MKHFYAWEYSYRLQRNPQALLYARAPRVFHTKRARNSWVAADPVITDVEVECRHGRESTTYMDILDFIRWSVRTFDNRKELMDKLYIVPVSEGGCLMEEEQCVEQSSGGRS